MEERLVVETAEGAVRGVADGMAVAFVAFRSRCRRWAAQGTGGLAGDGGSTYSDGSALSRLTGAVVVTINYCLAALGHHFLEGYFVESRTAGSGLRSQLGEAQYRAVRRRPGHHHRGRAVRGGVLDRRAARYAECSRLVRQGNSAQRQCLSHHRPAGCNRHGGRPARRAACRRTAAIAFRPSAIDPRPAAVRPADGRVPPARIYFSFSTSWPR